jgi:hypothetical protein
MGWSEFRDFVLRSSTVPSKLDPHPTHVVVAGQTAKCWIDSPPHHTRLLKRKPRWNLKPASNMESWSFAYRTATNRFLHS